MIDSTTRIAIAGYGLLGRLLAWRLAFKGYKVSVYEAGDITNSPAAAFTAAGMVAPASEVVSADTSLYELGIFALTTWPQWLQELAGTEGEDCYHPSGSLLVTHPQDFSELLQFEQTLARKLNERAQCVRLTAEDLQKRAPDLNPVFGRALYLADEAHVDNHQLLALLHRQLLSLGGEIVDKTPVQVASRQIITSTESFHFDCVIDCRGLGAKSALPQLRGVRGELLRLHCPQVKLPCPVRLMHPRYQLYVVPKPAQQFVIGATQIESEDTSPVSLQSTLELGSALYTLVPAFAEARVLNAEVNLRPAFNDNKPRIHRRAGLLCANGLFRHGYLLAPAVVDSLVAEMEECESPFAKQLITTSDREVCS